MTSVKDERQRAARQRNTIVSNPTAVPCCATCAHPYTFINHLHHVRPVAMTSGSATETIWLCPNCHALVHEMIRLYIRTPKRLPNRAGREYQMQWLFDEDAPELARKLFNIAQRSILND